MKLILKRFAQVLLIAFIVFQFIRPTKNNSKDISTNDITTKYTLPKEVQAILVTSCYDCHSNHTNYPWYANIQPIAWWLNDHIKEGKKELNFSVFSSYKIGRQYKKLEEISNEISENKMPLKSYTYMHKKEILTTQQKEIITNWANALRDSIEGHYPADSLKKRPTQSQAK